MIRQTSSDIDAGQLRNSVAGCRIYLEYVASQQVDAGDAVQPDATRRTLGDVSFGVRQFVGDAACPGMQARTQFVRTGVLDAAHPCDRLAADDERPCVVQRLACRQLQPRLNEEATIAVRRHQLAHGDRFRCIAQARDANPLGADRVLQEDRNAWSRQLLDRCAHVARSRYLDRRWMRDAGATQRRRSQSLVDGGLDAVHGIEHRRVARQLAQRRQVRTVDVVVMQDRKVRTRLSHASVDEIATVELFELAQVPQLGIRTAGSQRISDQRAAMVAVVGKHADGGRGRTCDIQRARYTVHGSSPLPRPGRRPQRSSRTGISCACARPLQTGMTLHGYERPMDHAAAPLIDIDVPAPLAALRRHAERVALATGAGKALYWDERVNLPPGAVEDRGRQRAWLAGIEHELRGGPAAREALADAVAWDPTHPEVVTMRRAVERATAVPGELVERTADATLHAHHAWHLARETDDAASFLPHLRTLVELAREEAAALDASAPAYSVLLDRWEPGADADQVASVLERLATRITPLVRDAAPVDTSILDRPLDETGRHHLERELLGALGFDWHVGRIDATRRAFCVTLGQGDVRLTTRFYDVPGLRNLHCSMHEAGHGIYAQGLQRIGLPATIADVAGLGLDESQSRLFERRIGASPAFWEHHFPRLVRRFPDVYRADEQDAFVAAMRAPDVDLLRIDSGEAAYNLHVLLRLRIERALIDGSLDVADLAGVWNEGMQDLLGLDVPDDRHGCLQDVHWALGQWGYFPTYALGNIYAAQLLDAARGGLGFDLDEHLAEEGTALPLRHWLDEHVYTPGCSMTSAEIVQSVTGHELDETPLVRHLESLFG